MALSSYKSRMKTAPFYWQLFDPQSQELSFLYKVTERTISPLSLPPALPYGKPTSPGRWRQELSCVSAAKRSNSDCRSWLPLTRKLSAVRLTEGEIPRSMRTAALIQEYNAILSPAIPYSTTVVYFSWCSCVSLSIRIFSSTRYTYTTLGEAFFRTALA